MLTVIQYYISIKIKKTKASRKDLKKGKNMINQKKDFNMITKKLETELSSFYFDGLEISEITPKTSWMKLHINVLFIKGNVQITKVLYKDYETGLWYYIKNDGMIISHKDTFNHTIKNLIDEMIYDCHIEIEAEETEATEETEKDVIEVKQELNVRFGKEQYFDTDSLQPNKAIIAKIENINYCPNQNTCCVVSPFVHCDYNYKSEACIKAHKNFIDYCDQVHKQIKAISNPEWHHVSLATLANIDFDMLDEKRKLVCNINQILKDGIRNLYKCDNHISFEVVERYVIRKCDELIRQNRLKAFWFSYIARQLDEVRRNTIYLYAPYITAHRNRW
jgi:hypothetical protein